MTTMIAPGIALFEEFRLDRRGGGLFQVDGDGRVVPVALGARALDLLCVLVERAGDEVSKNAIMDAVWPDVAVEENNLTVQISALRRVLDQDRAGSSCIQTVKGRGYRFVIPVTWLPAPTPAPTPPPTPAPASPGEPVAAMPTPEQDLPPPPFASPARRWWHAGPKLRRGLPVAAVAMSLTLAVPFLGWLPERGATKPPPRMSVAVLPFVSLDGDPEDVRKAEGVTQDLTTDLAFGEMRRVVSQRAVAPYAGMIEDVRQLGAALDVRYAVEGTVRRIGHVTRVTIAIISTETAAELWTDRIDLQPEAGASEQEAIRRWASRTLRQRLFAIEAARSLRERPDSPDTLDLLIEANALDLEPPSLPRARAAEALFQRALDMDPSSVPAMTGLAGMLLERMNALDEPPAGPVLTQVRQLLAAAESRQPDSRWVLRLRGNLLRTEGRWWEAEAAYQKLIDAYPSAEGGEYMMGICKLALGRPDEAIVWFQRAIRSSPHSEAMWAYDNRMSEATLLLGRDEESITWAERALAADPELPRAVRSWQYIKIAAAHALLGHPDDARAAVAEANRIWPYHTAGDVSTGWDSPALAPSVERIRDALRQAGLRDHVDENADQGIPPQADLHGAVVGPTPVAISGAKTIHTPDLVALRAQKGLLIIDAAGFGQSVPGAVGLPGAGSGGRFDDQAQSLLGRKLAALTGGDKSTPIVTLGWSAERWEGYNLALRLVALGYTDVRWYRGGRSAWRLAGQPLADLDVQDW